MIQLLKTEWLKLRKYPAFWWLIGIVALTYPGINLIFNEIYKDISNNTNNDFGKSTLKMLIGNPFSFPETWHTISYFSSWFLIVPAILVIMFMANEYTYKTHRQNIIDGWERHEFMMAKLIDVLLIASIVTLLCTIVALIMGISHSTEIQLSRWAEQLYYVPLFLLQTFAQLSIAFLCGFIFKRSFIALGVFMFYFLIVESIIAALFSYQLHADFLTAFLPLEMSDRLIPPPAFFGRFDQTKYEEGLANIKWHVLYTTIFTSGIWWLCFKLYKKKDL